MIDINEITKPEIIGIAIACYPMILKFLNPKWAKRLHWVVNFIPRMLNVLADSPGGLKINGKDKKDK